MNTEFWKLLITNSIPEKKLYQEIWSRKHISASFFLRNAVRSSLADAIRATSQWIDNCRKAKIKCNSLAERVYIADINYSLLLPGALLSTIILSATAIEAFLRHCYVSVLRTNSPRIGHAAFLDKISAFNNKRPLDKIQDVISQVNVDQLTQNIETEIRDIFSFRNDVVHNDPIYHSHEFPKIFQIKQGKDKKPIEKKPRQYKYYPDLTSSNRPLCFAHAILATTSHDKLVQHITKTAQHMDILNFLEEVDMTNSDSGLIWNGLFPGINYNGAKVLSEEMSAINKELSKVSIKEMTTFLKNMKAQFNDKDSI